MSDSLKRRKKIIFFIMFYIYRFFHLKNWFKSFWQKKKNLIFLYVYIYIYIFFLMSDLLIPSFLVSDVSKSLRFSPKMSKWVKRLFFLSESLIRSFLGKKRAICSENQMSESSPAVGPYRCSTKLTHWIKHFLYFKPFLLFMNTQKYTNYWSFKAQNFCLIKIWHAE